MTTPLLDVAPRVLLRAVVHGTPIPQGSKTVASDGRGRAWVREDNPRLKPWRAQLRRRLAAVHAGAPYDGPVEVRCCFAFPVPASAPKSWRALARFDWAPSTADVDKCVRALLDGLQAAGVLVNDARVVRVVAEKRYAGHPLCPLAVPGVAVEVRAL